jgi:molybdopterin-guanine dinucleotide biosynthesis protein MobB
VKQLQHHSYLVCVTGLKNSGKTTVCTALIAVLTSRGYTVAALKSSHVARLTLDHRSGDSYALAESGARFVLVQGSQESLILERGGRSFRQMLERVPEEVDFIVSEGGEPRAAGAVVVCLADPSDWAETLRVRRVPRRDKILAVAGSFVRSIQTYSPDGAAGGVKSFEGIPIFDATRDEDRQTLVEQILRTAGDSINRNAAKFQPCT